jgi:hypothetical protein
MKFQLKMQKIKLQISLKYIFEASKVFMFSVCEVISHEEVFCKDENLNLIDENLGNENEKKNWN